MTINVDCANGGSARVELLDENGYRVPGFTKDDAVPIDEDTLRGEAGWKQKSLADLPAGEYLIRLHLHKTEVFGVTLK